MKIARAGSSLIEVLMSIAILATVMTSVAVTMHVLYRADRQLKVDAAYGHVVPRLSLQFRTDVHAASNVALRGSIDAPAGILLTLAAQGESIEYQTQAGRVIRTRRGNQEELGREVYALGKTATLNWRTSDAPAPLVELEIVRAVGKTAAADARQVDRVVAALGIGITRETRGAADAIDE